MSTFRTFWHGLPRWAHWAAIAIAIIIVYFAIVEPGQNFIGSYLDRSKRIESDLARDKELLSPTSDDGRLMAIGRQSFGDPLLPTDKSASAETLYRVVDRILKGHGIDDAKINEHKAQLRTDLLIPVVGGGSVDRFTVDVTFETEAHTALDILAELEQAPEVTAVSRVKFDKQGARTASAGGDEQLVRVTFSPEMWIAAKAGTGGIE